MSQTGGGTSRLQRLKAWWASSSPTLEAESPTLSKRHCALIILGLVVLAVIPRTIVALRLVSVCNDAYYYNWAAEMLANGDYEKPLQYLNVNIYPFLLWGMRAVGLDSLEAGKWWGVIASGLTVIPLFLLLRRLLDVRVAIAGCFLFAIHPELIEIAVEPIREPTFWLLLITGLLVLHKAADADSGLSWTIAAGVLFALTVHTRTEGLGLLAPWFVWMVWKRQVVSRRLRLRALLVPAMIPLFLIVVNVTILADHDRFEWGRFTAVRNIAEWALGKESAERKTQPAPVHPGDDVASLSFGARSALYVKEAVEEFEYINATLLLFGFLVLRSQLLSRELLPLLLIFGGQMLAVWVKIVQIGSINGRYFLTAYVVAIPTMACGALHIIAAIKRFAERRGHAPGRHVVWSSTAALLLVVLFWVDAIDSPHGSRRRAVDLGTQLRANYGPFRFVETDLLSTRAGYAAGNRFPHVGEYHGDDHLQHPPPDLVILRPQNEIRFEARIKQAGLVPLDVSHLNRSGKKSQYRVYIRPRVAGEVRRPE